MFREKIKILSWGVFWGLNGARVGAPATPMVGNSVERCSGSYVTRPGAQSHQILTQNNPGLLNIEIRRGK